MAKTLKQKITFSFRAPEAQSVQLAGDFTDWEQSPVALQKAKNGVWKKTMTLPPGTYEYRLLVDGQWADDPQCPSRRPNAFGSQNCVCAVNGS
jgi:1,4-alpha-glucan branching enzyme